MLTRVSSYKFLCTKGMRVSLTALDELNALGRFGGWTS